MSTLTLKPDLVSPWVPMSEPRDLKRFGKLTEEAGELTSAAARCMIQGLHGLEPVTKKPNKTWLEEEIADVIANIEIVVDEYKLDKAFIRERVARKRANLLRWAEMLP